MNNSRTRPVLLVEDNRYDAELALDALTAANLANRVDVVRDGVDALEYLFCTGAHAGRDPEDLPAIVLLDIKLPRLNGIEGLQRLRADPRTRKIPVVMLTSSREERDVAACYDQGVNSYIVKPVDFQQFTRAVGQLGLYWLVLNEAPSPGLPPQ